MDNTERNEQNANHDTLAGVDARPIESKPDPDQTEESPRTDKAQDLKARSNESIETLETSIATINEAQSKATRMESIARPIESKPNHNQTEGYPGRDMTRDLKARSSESRSETLGKLFATDSEGESNASQIESTARPIEDKPIPYQTEEYPGEDKTQADFKAGSNESREASGTSIATLQEGQSKATPIQSVARPIESEPNPYQTQEYPGRDKTQGEKFASQNKMNLTETFQGEDMSSKLSKSNEILEEFNESLQKWEITAAVRESLEAIISKLEDSIRKTKTSLERDEIRLHNTAKNVGDKELSMDCRITGSTFSASKEENQVNVVDPLDQLHSEQSKMRNHIKLLDKKIDDTRHDVENQIQDIKSEIDQRNHIKLLDKKIDDTRDDVENQIQDIKSEIDQMKSAMSFQQVRTSSFEGPSCTESSEPRQNSSSKRANPILKFGKSIRSISSKSGSLKSSDEDIRKTHSREHSTSDKHRQSQAEDQHVIHYPNIVDTGMYANEATPSALTTCVDNVKNSLAIYAKEVQAFAMRKKLTLDYSAVGDERISYHLKRHSGQKTPLIEACLIQSFVSEQMFQNFELPSFAGIIQALFEKPVDHKTKRLNMYKEYKGETPETMNDQLTAFKTFLNRKLPEVRNAIICKLFTESVQSTAEKREHRIPAVGPESFPIPLRLLKAIWLLHTLVFACQPASAEIFRVPAGSPYTAEYMKESEDLRGQVEGAERKVACMTVPGFTLRSAIIRADVCCLDSLTSLV
ncbi:hypothetical protein KP509_01G017700 [Ceratopteris richardii]|uniref:Uncharacterized protein n=1 Tax=Ceratopteris richardii TaxID=49495 RepID=A0A8T2VAV2_CERRI|nr:hypothetical protein KP509_01G017700 [Ceratopteris richardii]